MLELNHCSLDPVLPKTGQTVFQIHAAVYIQYIVLGPVLDGVVGEEWVHDGGADDELVPSLSLFHISLAKRLSLVRTAK